MIPVMKVFMSQEAKDSVVKVMDSGWTGEGAISKNFEKEISEYIGRSGCLLNSGTSALELAFHCLGINRYSKVLCTPMTCAATTMPLVRAGCEIQWLEVGRDGCVDANDFMDQITSDKFDAVVVMDFGGMPCDWEKIMLAAKAAGVPVVGDCAQSLGSTYNGKSSMFYPDYSILSLQSVKIVSSVDGGFLFADEETISRCKKLRWFGIDRFNRDSEKTWEYDIEESGYKYHMNDTLSSIGAANFKYLPSLYEHNRKLAEIYSSNLPEEILIKERENSKSNYWMYTILVEKRADLIKKLKENGIGYGIGHNDNRTYSCITNSVRRFLPGVDTFYKNHLILPMHYQVTEENAKFIANTISQGW